MKQGILLVELKIKANQQQKNYEMT